MAKADFFATEPKLYMMNQKKQLKKISLFFKQKNYNVSEKNEHFEIQLTELSEKHQEIIYKTICNIIEAPTSPFGGIIELKDNKISIDTVSEKSTNFIQKILENLKRQLELNEAYTKGAVHGVFKSYKLPKLVNHYIANWLTRIDGGNLSKTCKQSYILAKQEKENKKNSINKYKI